MSSLTLLSGSLPSQLSNSKQLLVKLSQTTPLVFSTTTRRSFAPKLLVVRSSSSTSTELVEKTTPTEPNDVEKVVGDSNNNILACPICYDRLSLIGNNPVLSLGSYAESSLKCNTCKKTYSGRESHLELIASSGSKAYDDVMPLATEFFRLPLISFLYERGWRQNFVWGGFPGPEKEFEYIKNYLGPVVGGNIVDASCGSGLFSRLFAKSGLFSHVVALDYSENMLKQCYDFIKQEDNFPEEKIILARADIARLPFLSGSIDAVHAGAAIHCWPSPTGAVAEVSRVLRPGGVFVGTTYLLDGPYNLIPFYRPLLQRFTQTSGSQFFFSEKELEDICAACGLFNFSCTRNERFIMFTAKKSS